MTEFLIGYVILAVIILLIVNFAFRSKKAKTQDEKGAEATTPQPEVKKDNLAHPEPIFTKEDAQHPHYEPLPVPNEEFLDAAEAYQHRHDENREPGFAAQAAEGRSERVTEQTVDVTKHETVVPDTAAEWTPELEAEPTGSDPEATAPGAPVHEKRVQEKTEEAPAPAAASTGGAAAAAAGAAKAAFSIPKLIFVLMLGAFVAILNQTLVNVAMPHMMNELGVDATTIQWLVTGYMLVNGVMVPITAFLIERYGARKLFMVAMLLFTLGGLVCAVAPTFATILTGRLIQAAGAGIVMPLLMTVFLTIFPPEKRGAAMGLMGVAMIFAPAIGPTLSGWIVQNYSWRILFWLVVPIGLFDLVMAYFWFAEIGKQSKVKFDFLGFLFSTLGFGGILYGFSEAGSQGWGSAEVTIWLIIGAVSLILFVWRELTTDTPMLNLRVFKFNIFALTTTVASLINMAMMAAMVLLPIYLQNIRGFTPLESGLLLLPGAIIMGIMSPISGMLFDRIGSRPLAVVGLIITILTTWGFTRLTNDTSYGHILMLYCLRMFGMSFLMTTVMTEGMNQLPRPLMSHGTAASNTLRTVAGSLGTALLVSIMSNRQQFHLAAYSNDMTTTNPLFFTHVSALGQAMSSAMGLPSSYGTTVASQTLYGLVMKQATIDGINDAFVWGTAIAVVALLCALFIQRAKRPAA